MKQFVMIHYINPANQAPGVQTGHAPGVISVMRKTYKVFFSETMRATAYILGTY